MPTAQRELPTSEELALANYKIGSYMSDLDTMLSDVEAQSQTVGIDAAVASLQSVFAAADAPELDPEQLARVIVFATDALHDAESIRATASKLQEQALGLFHEHESGAAQEDAVRHAWHREQLDWLNSNDRKGGDDV